jgi:hypothetical protein
MNRIYQGRVSSVEIPNSIPTESTQPPWSSAPGGDELLWEHHAHFQDAVNYYLVGLLALATPSNKSLGQLRQRIAASGDEFQIWSAFRRRGANRRGLRESVARYLTPTNPAPTLDEAFEAVLAGNEADSTARDAAVTALLKACDGAGAIQQQGRAYWPKFCDPTTAANFAGDPAMLRRQRHKQLLPRVLNDPGIRHDSPALDEFDTFSIATPDTKRMALAGAKARERLHQAIALWRVRRAGDADEFDRLVNVIDRLSSEFTLPAYVGSSAKGEVQARLFALLLFKHVERSAFTFDLLRSATPPLRNSAGADPEPAPNAPAPGVAAVDPIRASRGARGYVFRAFTSLPRWNPDDTPEPQWKEFDIAAFKHALTALNQIEEKTKERTAEAAVARQRLDFMRGATKKFTGATEQEEHPPVLDGDPRIERLRALLASDALRTANALTDGEARDYGLHPRTIRGFRDLRKIWRRRAGTGIGFSPEIQARLREDLHDFQTEHSETVGSVALFDALLSAENWIVWQEPAPATAQAWATAGFAAETNDPLTALVEERELDDKLLRLAEPIRLTPADPIHSRRQYDFNAVSKFSAGPRAQCRHEAGALAFTTELAVCEAGRWRVQPVRLRYTAPRLLRDGLRSDDGKTDLASARWLQPMMEALAPAPELPQDLTDCPVNLMPDLTLSGDRRVLLNFPVTLDPAALVRQLGKSTNWDGQFCGPKVSPFALRWPADGWPADKEPSAWYRRGEAFTALGVDLGTRDAGAVAHVTVTPDAPSKTVHRPLGEAGGHSWFATLTGTQLIRLPGEDALVFLPGNTKPVTEPYGERGRLAAPAETADAARLISELGEDAEKLLGASGSEHRRFFSLQNDLLLAALRRAQARLARMQSWSARLREDAKISEAKAEIVAAYADRATLNSAEHLAANDTALLAQRELISRNVALVANRVLPLRGRRWIWVPNEREHRGHVLRQTDPGSDTGQRQIAGQRGLSHERLEQIEELRRRCQSLSRALAHAPGLPVRIGRGTRGDELPDPCPALLEKIEHMRDQRVDQTAHAILAAALGLRLRSPAKSPTVRRLRDIHGEYERFRAPVDFVVIEDLSRYLSTQDRARRENTRLMQWCHRQLVAKLRQLCETYGMPVLATPAAYSSRFCSRTGAAGFRAVELTPVSRHEAPWRWALARLAEHERGEKRLDGEALAEARRVNALFTEIDRINAGRTVIGKPPRTLLAPIPGGPVFVPLSEAPAMQADLNAATNIALRGIAAPDRHDIHHRIRTERQKGGAVMLRATTKREKARWGEAPPSLTFSADGSATERAPNLFPDLARAAEFDRVTLAGLATPFATGRGIWTAVKRRAWDRCAALNRARIAKWNADAPVPGHPEI